MRAVSMLIAVVAVMCGLPQAVSADPGRSGIRAGSLKGVSCVSAGFCMAVGAANQQSTSLVWDGSTWSRASTVPVGVYAELDAVSCSSATRCTAVGYSETDAPYLLRPIVQVYDGVRWRVVAAPRKGTESQLSAVSCPVVNFCAAVGSHSGSDGLDHAFIELWNGSSWRVVPNSPRGRASYLQGVSCTIKRACTAVGFSTKPGGYRTMVEEGDASTPWTLVATPNRGLGDQLYSVDCTAKRACEAAGTSVEMRDAEGWSLQTTPRDNVTGIEYGISCVSSSACQTVGGSGPFAMGWNGTKWREESTPDVPNGGTLYAIDCVSAGSCLAVGQRTAYDSGGFPYPKTLAEQWDGASWKQIGTPNL